MFNITLLLITLLCNFGTASAEVEDTDTGSEVPTITQLMGDGHSSNRVNIVFLSEAYVASQRETFFDDVNMAVEEMFKRTPFREYKNFINVHSVWVASKDSLLAEVGRNEETRTYFGEWGGLSPSLEKIDSVSRSFFGPRDPIVAVLLINDGGFSGEGSQPQGISLIGVGVLGSGKLRRDSAPFIREIYTSSSAHELGHALAGLRDEYTGTFAMKPGQTERDFQGPFLNVTTQSRRNLIRWKYWIDPSIPIPTPNSQEYVNKVGLFEGANVFSSGWYRSQLKCTMGSYKPDIEARPSFCAVCREALVLAIYEYVNPLAEVSTDVGEHTTTFTINPPQPVDHALQIQWLVDGSVIASGVTDLSVVDTEIGYGQHTIRVRVVDKTEFVRSDPERLLQRSLEWNVVSYPEPDFDGSGAVDFEDFFLFADAFGLARSSVTEKYDLNWDGKVDFLDFFLFADDFGKSISKKQIFKKQ